jgi:hypothetical protein
MDVLARFFKELARHHISPVSSGSRATILGIVLLDVRTSTIIRAFTEGHSSPPYRDSRPAFAT